MRSLSLDQLRTLVEVVEQGSFTAAAKHLNLTQPAVSLQIRDLEARFGLQLVERVGKRAYATEPGRELIEHAKRLLRESGEAVDAMRRYKDGWLGRVHVGASGTVLVHLLPPVLRSLSDAHPGLDLVITTGTTSDVVEAIMANVIDVGLVTLPVAERALEVVPVLSEPLIAVLPMGASGLPDELTPQDLAGRPLVLETERASVSKLITGWFADAGLAPHPAMVLDSVEAIKAVVAAGIGAAILPQSSLMAGVVRDELITRPLMPPLARTLAYVQRRGKPEELALRHVREALLSLGEA